MWGSITETTTPVKHIPELTRTYTHITWAVKCASCTSIRPTRILVASDCICLWVAWQRAWFAQWLTEHHACELCPALCEALLLKTQMKMCSQHDTGQLQQNNRHLVRNCFFFFFSPERDNCDQFILSEWRYHTHVVKDIWIPNNQSETTACTIRSMMQKYIYTHIHKHAQGRSHALRKPTRISNHRSPASQLLKLCIRW